MVWEASAKKTPRMPVQEIKRLVEEALGTLNEPQRQTIQRVIFEGLTLREVAEHSGESYSAVRNHYYRGLDHLRACLTPQPATVRAERALPFGEVNPGKA